MSKLNFGLDPTDLSAASIAEDKRRLRHAVLTTLWCVAVLWLVLLAQLVIGFNPGEFGVRPRQLAGLIGVITAPLVHEGFAHLAANTSALLVLGVLAVRTYPRATRIALPVIWLGSGLLVWWFARPSSHIGASGIAVGLMTLLFTLGLLRRERLAIVTAMVVFFLYGGMVQSMLPHDPHVSFEYHLAGGVIGIIMAILLRHRDPLPPRKLYSWDLEDDEDEDTDADAPPEATPRVANAATARNASPSHAATCDPLSSTDSTVVGRRPPSAAPEIGDHD